MRQSRTLGDRLRDRATWSRSRRSVIAEKEATPTPSITETDAGDKRVEDEASDDQAVVEMQDQTPAPGPGSRLSRIFSLRRSAEPPSVNERTHPDNSLLHHLAEEDEAVMLGEGGPMSAPPSLPPPPCLMSPDQTKRRFIINSLVQSENNYLDSLNRLITDYKRPLEASNPPILSESKVTSMFYRVPEILQIHAQFRIALSEAVKNWDEVRKYFNENYFKLF